MALPSSVVQTEGQYSGDWLKWEQEANGKYYSREQITILAGSGADRVLTSGMVLGKITSGGKYIQVDDALSNGAEAAAGILLYDVTAVNGTDAIAVAILRDAIVSSNGLTWPSGYNTTTGEAALEVLRIQVREGA